jgi:hypothetical protein
MKDYEIQTNMYSSDAAGNKHAEHVTVKQQYLHCADRQVIGQLHLEISCVKAQFTGARLRYILI